MKRRSKRNHAAKAKAFPIAVAAAVLAIAAAAGYVYGQNTSGGAAGAQNAAYAQYSGSGMSIAACSQMMRGLNVSQGAINAMDQMMNNMHHGGNMMQNGGSMMQNS